jgi:hypothetical protein
MERLDIGQSAFVPDRGGESKAIEAEPFIREVDNCIFIEGSPSQTKSGFFAILERRVVYLDQSTYEGRFRQHGLGHCEGVVRQVGGGRGKVIENPAVYINAGVFVLDGEDYSDLIPFVVRHEIVESWTYAKTGYSLSPPPPHIGNERRATFAHGLALRKEYEYAFESGKADRLLEFIIKFITKYAGNSPSAIRENQEAYQIAKERYERKLRRGQ